MITDIHMPVRLDGTELARIIDDRWPFIAVIVTSGGHQDKSLKLPSCTSLAPTPWTLQQLFEVVQQQLPKGLRTGR